VVEVVVGKIGSPNLSCCCWPETTSYDVLYGMGLWFTVLFFLTFFYQMTKVFYF